MYLKFRRLASFCSSADWVETTRSQTLKTDILAMRLKYFCFQLAKFRELAHVSSVSGDLHYHDYILENYRPVQDIVNRTVYTSYDLLETSGAISLAATSAIVTAILFCVTLFR